MSAPSKGGLAARLTDLGPRLWSGLALAVAGILMVVFGGWLFILGITLAAGLMTWELARMCRLKTPEALGAIAGLCLLGAALVQGSFGLTLLFLPALVGLLRKPAHPMAWLAFAVGILAAAYGLLSIRAGLGAGWLGWLILCVVVTDVAGYFAGRLIGGPKFWPAISPKKTWSGTAAGWICAAFTGAVIGSVTGQGVLVVLLCIGISMASQLGDIAESALKRRVGVKDSSALIPGHGGVFDRFDGVLGATLFFMAVKSLTGFPAAVWG